MTHEVKPTELKLSRQTVGWLLAYIVVVVLVVGGLFYGRQRAFALYGSDAAQAEWDAWREDAKKLAEESGPVKRRVPKSVEPPALVLMRDHFLVCLVGSLLLTSVLFGTFMVLVRGALGGSLPTQPRSTDY